MNEALILAGATLISGVLIISNEWLKRYLDNNHKKKKFKLWGKIYNRCEKDMPTTADNMLKLLREG